jgi:ribonuclease VapC
VIVDSSALVAILRSEPEASQFAEAIADAEVVRLSSVGYVESGIVVDSWREPTVSRRLDALIGESHIAIEPFTAEQARIAREAYRDFGKGSGHRAQLNFGDCMTYALAKDKREPLLFKGNDFDKTDVQRAE